MAQNRSSASPAMPTNSARLELVYFGLFDNCNVKCNMCDCWRLPRSKLPLNHYQRVLSGVLSLKPRAIRFTGGEPLLFKGLPDLVHQAADAGVRVSVITNGRILRSKIAALVENGCTEIVLSIDAVGDMHDSIRGVSGLFDHCYKSINTLSELALPYGVNTVLQARGASDIETLGELLRTAPRPPAWWHIIPVRGNFQLQLDKAAMDAFHALVPRLRNQMQQSRTAVIVADDFLHNVGADPCSVPAFTVYVRADSGELFGCNMLAYSGHPIGNILDGKAEDSWSGNEATDLRKRCASGTNASCARCDLGSKAMNFYLRDLACKT